MVSDWEDIHSRHLAADKLLYYNITNRWSKNYADADTASIDDTILAGTGGRGFILVEVEDFFFSPCGLPFPY